MLHEAGLDDCDGIEVGECLPRVRTRDPRMFEPEPMVPVLRVPADRSERRDRVFDAEVPDCVHREAESGPRGSDCVCFEVLHDITVSNPVAADLHVQGDRDAAVGEELGWTYSESVIALTGRRALEPRTSIVAEELRAVGHDQHGHRERISSREVLVHLLGVGRARGVVHRDDSLAQEETRLASRCDPPNGRDRRTRRVIAREHHSTPVR